MRYIIPIIICCLLSISGCNAPTEGAMTSSVVELPGDEQAPAAKATPTPRSSTQRQPTPTTETAPPIQMPTGPEMPPLEPNQPVIITEIHMLSEQQGWGIGHQGDSSDHILFTNDGGQTWADRTPPEPAPGPEERLATWAHFADARLVWVIYAPEGGPPPTGDSYIWYTHNGGETWLPSQSLPTAGLEAYFVPEGFAFVDEKQGWFLVHIDAGMSHDYSYLFGTSDGGITWQRITDPYGVGLQSLHNSGLAFKDDVFGWVTKDNLGVMAGAFFEQTSDGGITWEDVFLPAPPEHDWFTEFSRCQTSAPIFTAGESAALIVKCKLYDDDTSDYQEWTYSYIYTTQDLGKTWEHSLLPAPVDSLLFLNNQEGWAFGREHFKTTDGGLSWAPVKSVNWDGQFSFVSSETGWAVASNEGEIALVSTADGGQTWQIIQAKMQPASE